MESELLLGVFVNTLVLRTDLSGDPSFRELLRRIRGVALGAYTNQDLPFEILVEVLRPDRDLSRNPLFDVMFQLRNTPERDVAFPGLRTACIDFDIGVAKFDLTLEAIDQSEGLECRFEYNTDLFDAATIERMAGHFQILLEGIVANPDQCISDLPLLSESERRQLLVEWNGTNRDYPDGKCIHELFEQEAERSPDAVAVIFEAQQLTYRELNARVNQLAHYLRKRGVGPDVLVAICMERSLEMIIGLLGILKTRGAYVPLDPSYPMERLALMLADTRAKVVLTQARLRNTLSGHGAHVACLDTEWAEIEQQSAENPANRASLESLAYVIYTSGSTGKPKGAMNTHRGLCNRLQWMQEIYQLSQSDRVLQKTPFSFDVSVWEFFWPIIAGARLVIARPAGHQDSRYLVDLIRQQGITTLHFVPSMLRAFLEEPRIESCKSLRQVFCKRRGSAVRAAAAIL